MITGVNHTSFTVSDVERSIAFYRDLLGMELLSLAERDPIFSERVTAIPGAHLKVAYLKAPDGHRLELIEYLSPKGKSSIPRPTMSAVPIWLSTWWIFLAYLRP